MNDTTKAQLFRAAQRRGRETNRWRSLDCFGLQGHRCSNTLRAVTEHTIAGKASVHRRMEQDTLLLLVPTVGTIIYTDTLGCRNSISAGQAYLSFLPAWAEVTLGNPYTDHLVNVLQFNLLCPANARPENRLYNFDLTANPDCLVEVLSCSNWPEAEAGTCTLNIGKFAGRSEAMYRTSHIDQKLFVYVIEGAFEVQYRLMERGDGLLLWNGTEIELEALSNSAVILLLQLAR